MLIAPSCRIHLVRLSRLIRSASPLPSRHHLIGFLCLRYGVNLAIKELRRKGNLASAVAHVPISRAPISSRANRDFLSRKNWRLARRHLSGYVTGTCALAQVVGAGDASSKHVAVCQLPCRQRLPCPGLLQEIVGVEDFHHRAASEDPSDQATAMDTSEPIAPVATVCHLQKFPETSTGPLPFEAHHF